MDLSQLLPILALLAILAVVMRVLKALFGGTSRGKPGKADYTLRKTLLSAAERSFYGVLINAVGSAYVVVPKVRVADVLAPRRAATRSEWQRAFNKVSAKHFDFVICRADDFGMVAAVELDDMSHRQARRQGRDAFLMAAAQSAGLSLLRFEAKAAYSQANVREQFGLAVV